MKIHHIIGQKYRGLYDQYENPKSLMSKKIQLVSQEIKGGNSLLDLGCGTGELISRIKQKFKLIIGIDLDYDAVRICRERFKADPIEIIASDAEKLPFSLPFFDYVTALDVLEHLNNPVSTVKKVFEILKPQGKFLVTMPNWYDKIMKRLRPSLHKHAHSSFGWATLLRREGFRIQSIRTVAFPVVDSQLLAKHLHLFGICVFIVAKKY